MNRTALLAALASRGAAVRYAEIEAELAALVAVFPELRQAARPARHTARSATNGTGAGHAPGGAAASPTGPPKRRGPRMTAAQRKAVSVRMAKYWRERHAREARLAARAAAGGRAAAAKRRAAAAKAEAAAKGGTT